MESGNHGMESIIPLHEGEGEGRYTYRHMVAMAYTRVSHVEDLAWNNLFHRWRGVDCCKTSRGL